MRKLIFILCALTAATAGAQDFEQIEAREKAAMDAIDAETREYFLSRGGVISAADSIWFFLKQAESDSLEYIRNGKVLDAMLRSEPPFDYVFMDKLSLIAQDIMNRGKIFGGLHARAVEVYEHLGEEGKTSEMGESVRRALFPLPEIVPGDAMPDYALAGIDGATHNLSDYRGKYVLLDVWSSSCSPCIAMFPDLDELQEANREKLTVVGICRDVERNWRAASARYPFHYPNFFLPPDHELEERLRLYLFPQNVLVSPEGTVLAVWKGTLADHDHLRGELRQYIPDLK